MAFLLVNLLSFCIPGAVNAETGDSYTAEELAGKAIDFIKQKFDDGEEIDGYTAYLLTLAGEDLTSAKWTRNNKTLKSRIEELADLLGDNNSLITYITATQNANGTFGPFANEYGTKAPLQALALVKSDLPVGEDICSEVQDSITRAVYYFRDGYASGVLTYEVNGYGFDYRCIEALAAVGEDLSVGEWVYNGKSLKEEVIASAGAAAGNPSVLDAVYLAKELTALYAVEPGSSDIDTLAGAIIDKRNTTPDKVYFGSSIYDNVMVLTALGKTGKLSGIDQAKALNYLNDFKHTHKNSWGQDAGSAWGGWSPEEADLTAQVITALSYFDGADVNGSEVYNAIQEGLTYLQDIQNDETAAIPHEWDSTFATAETLIALKALGKGYEEYAGPQWVKNSKTKTIAQCLLALNEWGDTARVNALAGLLQGRHTQNGFDNSIYSDMWAYIALGEAGKIDLIDKAEARQYILSKQSTEGENAGAWGESFGQFYPDFMSTAQAIRALTYLPGYSADPEIQDAINNGLTYLQGHQQADGSVYVTQPWPDDPVVDTAEVIITLNKLGQDPENWENEQGLTPVSYMMNNALNDDGSFGTVKNILGASEALYAYLFLGDASTGGDSSGSGTSAGSHSDWDTVRIAVVGIDGELLYGPSSVSVDKNGAYGLTVLGALDATGLNYSETGGLVTSIAGQANSGMNGWMYKVNGSVPPMSAAVKTVSDGDRIIWWYSTDISSTGPSWDELSEGIFLGRTGDIVPVDLQEQNKTLPQALQASEAALVALENVKELLKNTGTELNFQETAPNVLVVGSENAMSPAEKRALRQSLALNSIDLARNVSAASGAVINDANAEVALSIPAEALSSDTEITVKKISLLQDGDEAIGGDELTLVPGGRQISAIYDFGPDGTVFSTPVTLALKIALPPLVRPENLALAWYDRDNQRWITIPAVVDMSRGLLHARIDHFTKFAVFAREVKKSFTDVTGTSFGWAKDVIETLAGAGIIAGVDENRFEPARAVTRAEFVSLLVRAMNLKEDKYTPGTFKDVKADAWYAGNIAAAAKAGLVKGYEDGTFRPDSTITREEVVAVLVRALELPDVEQEQTFKDEKEISAWARNSVATAASCGLVKGFEDGTFRPRANAGRAESAALIYRMIMEYL